VFNELNFCLVLSYYQHLKEAAVDRQQIVDHPNDRKLGHKRVIIRGRPVNDIVHRDPIQKRE
jgi:hypothetical protein